jgi:hypothetical protein
MFVPFDNLYNFLQQYVANNTLIYQFRVSGNRNISNVQLASYDSQSWVECATSIYMLMHDQEPLNFNYYLQDHTQDILKFIHYQNKHISLEGISVPALKEFYLQNQFELNVFPMRTHTIFDRWILCHSELNSTNLDLYKNIGAVGVYWWSHALISKDWFRFAMIDPRLKYKNSFKKDFNVYNRAWAGTREYRLKFTELILQNHLDQNTNITFSPIENSVHYTNYQFENLVFSIDCDLETLPCNHTPASASADYNHNDYQQCAIDVVLETLFDDTRLHLTEKTLRPIACGKPFILVSTAGSLQYLKNYGFKTFDGLIDESYDSILNPLDRLNAIIKLMKNISSMSPGDKENLYQEMHEIAKYNKKRFWSDEFSQSVINEFVLNYQTGLAICQKYPTGKNWVNFRNHLASVDQKHKDFFTIGTDEQTRKDMKIVYSKIKSSEDIL